MRTLGKLLGMYCDSELFREDFGEVVEGGLSATKAAVRPPRKH